MVRPCFWSLATSAEAFTNSYYRGHLQRQNNSKEIFWYLYFFFLHVESIILSFTPHTSSLLICTGLPSSIFASAFQHLITVPTYYMLLCHAFHLDSFLTLLFITIPLFIVHTFGSQQDAAVVDWCGSRGWGRICTSSAVCRPVLPLLRQPGINILF